MNCAKIRKRLDWGNSRDKNDSKTMILKKLQHGRQGSQATTCRV